MSPSHAIASLSYYLSLALPEEAAGAFLIAVVGVVLALLAHRRLRRMTLRQGESLEDTLGELSRRVRELGIFREELEEYLKVAEARLRTSLRGVGLVRFNPFEGDGSGGNQSFAAAFLDEKHNGVVFSALYAREGHTSLYAKPLEKGLSTFELTGEEKEAIRLALANLSVAGAKK